MRRAARVDDNQGAIVDALRNIPGCSVEVGHDDILVGFRNRTYWYELKNPEGRNRRQKNQETLELTWPGHYRVVTSVAEIIEEITQHG